MILQHKVLGTPAAELLARKFRRNVGAAKMLRQPPFWLRDFEADCWICRETRVHKALVKAVGPF